MPGGDRAGDREGAGASPRPTGSPPPRSSPVRSQSRPLPSRAGRHGAAEPAARGRREAPRRRRSRRSLAAWRWPRLPARPRRAVRLAAHAQRRRRGSRRGPAPGGAAVREPGHAGGRVLRRRRHRRDSRQAVRASRPPCHRPQQLDASTRARRSRRRRSARELGVDYLLTGTVRWEKGGAGEPGTGEPRADPGGHRLRPLAAALRRGADRRVPGAGRCRRPGRGGAQPRARHRQRERLAERPTQSLAAYDAYLKGEEVSDAIWAPATRRAPPGDRPLRAAVALDSSFRAGLGRPFPGALAALFPLGRRPRPRERPPALAAERALALGSRAPGGSSRSGRLPLTGDQRIPRALEQYALGLRTAPRNADLLVATALAEQTLGRWEAALQHLAAGVDARPAVGEHGASAGQDPAVAPPLSRGAPGGRAGPRARPRESSTSSSKRR